ncbi:transketolase family protein [Treponema sp. R6D11]
MEKATRLSFGEELAEIGLDSNIIVMDADLSPTTMTKLFAKKYPDRFIEAGIAEGNMMSVAAGMAATGKTVFAATFAMFSAGRAFEQIRNSIAYPKFNVKVCGTHAGISVGEDGASHQAIEDIALMRAVPNMNVVCPADDIETKSVIRYAAETKEPFYIRLSRLATPNVCPEKYEFELGKSLELKSGNDVTIITTGIMAKQALEAAEVLNEKGVSARVINMASIKPIDKDAIIKAAKETKGIVTIEEHSIIGGLGGAVCEVVTETCPCKVLRVGVEDKFGQSGKPVELFEKYGLTVENVIKKALELTN